MKKIILPIIIVLSAVIAYANQEKVLQIFKDGEVIQQYSLGAIDFIEINDVIPAPTNISAELSNKTIKVTWSAVESAVYNVYRSADNSVYNLIAENLSTTTYTDSQPLSGTNYYKVTSVINGRESEYSVSSSAITMSSSDLASGLYLGITAFNQTLYSYPIQQLTSDNISGFNAFVDGLTTKNGTLLYYSVDQAISTVQASQFPNDLFNVAIVTFTDGLDQGSMMMNTKYASDDEYLTALNSRIKSEKVAGQDIMSYSVGVRGNDVSDIAKFQSNLKMLASSDENAFEVSSMSEVNTKFKEIAKQLTETNYLQTISLEVPGVAAKMRFTFDNVTNAKNSQLYIEGDLNLAKKSLENVVYYGLTSTSGTTVQGEVVNNIFIKFTFDGVRTASKTLVTKEYMNEWTYVSSTSSWQINSEFVRDEQADIETEKRSAAIMLVLDCSKSLGDEFADVQTNAKSFISTLCAGVEDSVETPDNTEYPSDNLSTTPIDLSLAVVRDSVRYYVTQSDYAKMGNLEGYKIEGVTVISGSDSFIIALGNATTGTMNYSVASKFYYKYLPSKSEGIIISARFSDINSALRAFGGVPFGSSDRYWTSYTSGSLNYYIEGSGGYLGYSSNSSSYCYVRQVIRW